MYSFVLHIRCWYKVIYARNLNYKTSTLVQGYTKNGSRARPRDKYDIGRDLKSDYDIIRSKEFYTILTHK